MSLYVGPGRARGWAFPTVMITKQAISLDTLIQAIAAAPDIDAVTALMQSTGVEPVTCEQYARFDPTHYTRTVVYRDEHVEVVVVCWNVGQTSPVHDHGGAMGWTLVTRGELTTWNFVHVPRGHELPVATKGIWTFPDGSTLAEVGEPEVARAGELGVFDAPNAIHRVGNVSPHAGPVVSVNVYFPPISRYRMFDLTTLETRDMEVRAN